MTDSDPLGTAPAAPALPRTARNGPSRLQSGLAAKIVEEVRARRLPVGTRLSELGLARALRVSRTPVRGALNHLADEGLVEARPRRGFFLTRPGEALDGIEPPVEEDRRDRLYLAIVHDRLSGTLPDDFSEADLMRRYGVTRPLLARVLARMSEVGLTERKPGHGWTFLTMLDTVPARAESYRFRLVIEPAALLEPGFTLDRTWAHEMRRRHRAVIRARWRDTASIALYEMNAEFHEVLAGASRNRFFHMAVQQQNRLRRFLNYDWPFGKKRAVVSCREHLAILARLESGDNARAAALMRSHLLGASRLRRSLRSSPAADPRPAPSRSSPTPRTKNSYRGSR
jgi:DNA-binding GntR family transcriptional regulator